MDIVIVGSGVAGVTCAEALVKHGRAVSLVTRETAGYYSRPLLSHGFSRADIEQRIVMRRFDELRQNGIKVHAGCNVQRIDAASRRIICAGNEGEFSLDYAALVLAPGSEAFVPPNLLAFREQFQVLNGLSDLIALRRLRQQVLDNGQQPKWAMIGGGLIGCEVASDLAEAGDAVTLFHVAQRLMERQLQEDDSDRLLQTFSQAGIRVELSSNVAAIETDGEYRSVLTDSARHDQYHGVIVACGFKPRVQLAQEAGLAVQRGISVDGFLRSADAFIYAIGDAAQCNDGKIYAFIAPIRSQALWLANYLSETTQEAWAVPTFQPKAKIHHFTASHPL